MGSDAAVVIGSNGQDLYFSAVVLVPGDTPKLGGRLMLRGATQGETRTHGFFYKPQADGTGVLGLPVRSAKQPGWSQLVKTGAGILFARVINNSDFRSLGALSARDGGADDRCVASCVDWYGNSRPIFYRGRVIALLGYELVEGLLSQDMLTEARRAHLLPWAQGHMAPASSVRIPQESLFFWSAAEVADGLAFMPSPAPPPGESPPFTSDAFRHSLLFCPTAWPIMLGIVLVFSCMVGNS